MKALILNSGMGTRLGSFTKDTPKCLTKLQGNETILSRQLSLLYSLNIKDIVITTGPFEEKIISHCIDLRLPINCTFVNNPRYWETNYIYSIYCAKNLLSEDMILLHGDLVFSREALEKIINCKRSSMAVDKASSLPEKDFKAVINNGRIKAIGVEFFQNAAAAQPLYKLFKKDWSVWLREICSFCQNQQVNCYAEEAFNMVSDICAIYPEDMAGDLCCEVDTVYDLYKVRERLSDTGMKNECYAK